MNFLKGDCLEIMKTLPDQSVDCFICDLPYGCLTSAWDIKIDLKRFWEQVKRLAKNDHTPVLMFCTTKFGAELIASNPDWFRYDLVWNKSRGTGFLTANKMPMRSHEMIYVFAKKGAFYNRIDTEGKPYFKKSKEEVSEQYGIKRIEGVNTGTRCVLSVIDCLNSAGHHRKNKIGSHPTQKPSELYEWLLTRYCPKNGLMLDPTAGSFTSCFTANKLGIESIGIEINEEFYKKACKEFKINSDTG